MKMIGWAVMITKSNVSDQNVVCPELCGGCRFFSGFGCERSPIVTNGEEMCRCDRVHNDRDRTSVYDYNYYGHPQQYRKDGANDS